MPAFVALSASNWARAALEVAPKLMISRVVLLANRREAHTFCGSNPNPSPHCMQKIWSRSES